MSKLELNLHTVFKLVKLSNYIMNEPDIWHTFFYFQNQWIRQLAKLAS
jgi:hypothetical protein